MLTSQPIKPKHWLLAVAVMVLVAACPQQPEDDNEAKSSRAPELQRDQMREHAQVAEEGMRALIRGDVPLAKNAMAKLGRGFEVGSFEDASRRNIRAARLAAETGERAESLDQAAAAFAQLTRTCGECHQANKTGPPIQMLPVPHGSDIGTHMRRHEWVVTRMWEALRVRSTPAFMAAINVLDETPIHGTGAPDHERPAGTSEFASSLHRLAKGARSSSTPSISAQTELFGNVLIKCGKCHSALDARVTFID